MRYGAALLVFSFACGGPTSEVILSVDTDLAVPSELDSVRFTVVRAGREPVERSASLLSESVPIELGLLHDGGPLGPVDAWIIGSLAGEEIVERRVRFDFVRGQSRVVRIELSRACVGVACPDDETCEDGMCRPVELRPDELPPWMIDGGTGCGTEVCNGADDDCDGSIDEDFDLSTSAEHCGGCGRRCVQGPGASAAACEAGVCVQTCLPGRGDCDGDAANGCENNLDEVDHCGSCANSCTRFEAEMNCNEGRCELLACNEGRRDCDLNPDNGCESSLDDVTNCGGCGIRCSLFNAVESCGSGACTLSSCEEGFDNCDGRTENGCEADVKEDVFHCGGCARRCEANVPNSADVCIGGRCEEECYPGWKDCDGIASNGCETDLSLPTSCGDCGERCSGVAFLCSGTPDTGWSCVPPPCMDPPTRCGASCVDTTSNPRHCGSCDTVCPGGPNAQPVCVSSGCNLVCDPGYGDCDGDPTNGCEAALNDPFNCGGCGSSCALPGAIAACIGGTCLVAGCEPGFEDCNFDADDGCERPITTATDCGACGAACSRPNAVADCSTGACRIGVCEAGWGDCDGVDANGCETPLGPCETCAGTCVLPNAMGECRSDACAVADCDAGWGDCDGHPSNGCELSLTDNDHCGACGAACVIPNGVGTCSTGSCSVATCDPGFGDCDGDPSNGCESDLSDDASCGACGVACTGSELCALEACRGEWDLIHVDPGGRHSCGMTATGRVFCWGEGSDGRLGQGEWEDSLSPVAVQSMNNAIAVSAGAIASCAVRTGGVVACWGSNLYGQLASLTLAENQPRNTSIIDAVDVVVGMEHACALRERGTVLCWGRNTQGQIGNGRTNVLPVAPYDPGLTEIVQIDAGWQHTCALRSTGQVYCWGRNSEGQLGDGTTMMRTRPMLVPLESATWISAGGTSSAAIVSGGVWTWGGNEEGQLGDGSTISSSSPLRVPLAGAVAVHVGRGHACACLDEEVWCWGDNEFGQLGDGSTTDRLSPIIVPGVGAGELEVGVDHACHVDPSNVWCWGRNDSGQLGDSSTLSSPMPVGVDAVPTM